MSVLDRERRRRETRESQINYLRIVRLRIVRDLKTRASAVMHERMRNQNQRIKNTRSLIIFRGKVQIASFF
uniref:Uncharacterized protein n=1 Tax=Lepeophtheirus salmonis TaxID=72036 RepID=A0A0K2UQU1_LEPSM